MYILLHILDCIFHVALSENKPQSDISCYHSTLQQVLQIPFQCVMHGYTRQKYHTLEFNCSLKTYNRKTMC